MFLDRFGRFRMYTIPGETGIVYKGNVSAPAPIDPMREAKAQILVQQELARIQEEQRLAEEQRQAAKRETDLSNFNQTLAQLFESSLSSGTAQLERGGYDTERFAPLLREELLGVQQRIPELAGNPGSYFDTDAIVNNLLNRETTTERRGLNQQLDAFAAPGFALERVPNTLDDPILAAILSSQFDDASTSLLRARDRGNLSDFGFDTALAQLQTQRSAADSRLQSVGGGVLEDFRTGLRDVANKGRARADAFQFGDAFDPSSTKNALENLFAERSGRLEGDIRGAIGGEQLFDIGNILGRAGTAQGPQNQTAVSPAFLSAISQREEERAKRRGIGSQGVF